MKRKLLRIASYALLTFAMGIAFYILFLWAKKPELSYMALWLRYWYGFLSLFALAFAGGAAGVLGDQ